MRKLILMLAMILPVVANAQYFVLTENGLIPANGESKNFIVIEKEGKTAKQLFEQVKNYVSSSYVSPQDVMSVNGDDMITINGVSDGDVECKKGFVMLPFRTNYTITLMFKDGRIRINNPSINSMLSESQTLGGNIGSLYQLTLTKDNSVNAGGEQIVVFKQNGKTTKGAKESIEAFFNKLIDKIVNYEEEEW